MRQVMLADDDFHIHADFAGTPQNFGHAAHGCETSLRVALDFHVHHRSVEFRKPQAADVGKSLARLSAQFFVQFGSQLVARRNRDFVQDARVVRQHGVAMRSVAEKSHDGGMRVFHNLHHAALGSPVGAAAFDARQHAIAMHGIAQIVATDEEVSLHARNRRIGHQKGVAIAMRNDAPGDEIRIARTFWRGRGFGSFRGSRGRPFSGLFGGFARRARRQLGSRQKVFSSVSFFHFSGFFQFLDHARKVAPPAMPQPHAVGDLADAGGLRKRGKMRE